MPEEVVQHIYRLPLPLTGNPLGSVNSYLVVTDDGIRLIDCGWNEPEVYDRLVDDLAGLGLRVADITEIFITHIHPDHYGLASRLVEEAGAALMMHRLESVYLGARYGDTHELVEEMETWLRINGAPPETVHEMAEGSLRLVQLAGTRRPDLLLEGGEVMSWGPYRFEVIWTPGHSGGLVCLYDRDAEVLLSSDHVLQRISPNIALHAQSLGNPLGDYLSSLRRVRDLPVQTVLPGHGDPFQELAGRVDQLLEHHRRRSRQILDVLEEGPQTAHAIASQLSWKGSPTGWQELAPFQRRMALTETLAHLEYLYARGYVGKEFQHGIVRYHVSQ